MSVPARKNETLPANMLTGMPDGYDASTQSLAVSMAIAEVDQQITTAHAYPRSIDKAMKNILMLATMDEETAKECIYALPRAGKAIKGPGIRLAEIIQGQWGNNRVGTRVTHVDRIEKYVEAEGVFHDLETNSATTARVRRRISDKEGRLLNDDMIMVTSNAAASIAKRNAILGGVPKAIWRRAYDEVQRVLIGDVRTMTIKRDDAIKAFAGYGIKPEQLCEVLEIGGIDDIGIEEYTTLLGMHQAIRNGEATVEEMFPTRKGRPDSKPGNLGERLDQLAGESVSSDSSSGGARRVAADDNGDGEGLQQASAVADQSPAGPSSTGEGSGDPEPPSPTSPLPPDLIALRMDAIAAAMQIAGRTDFDAEQRSELLDDLADELADRLASQPAFIKKLVETAKEVVRKKTTKAAAQKYLASLKAG
jgi:hypothetical protein